MFGYDEISSQKLKNLIMELAEHTIRKNVLHVCGEYHILQDEFYEGFIDRFNINKSGRPVSFDEFNLFIKGESNKLKEAIGNLLVEGFLRKPDHCEYTYSFIHKIDKGLYYVKLKLQ